MIIVGNGEDDLQKRIDEQEGDVTVVLNGYWPDPPLRNEDRVRVVHLGKKHDDPISIVEKLEDDMSQELVSVIIPSRHELYLNNTVNNLLERADGPIEIIVVLDGPPQEEPPVDDRIRYIKHDEPVGMRGSINEAVEEAKGKYIMKCDAHCAFGKGFDTILKKDCKDDWVVVPRRYSIDKNKWDRLDDYKDYQYISSPKDKRYPFKGCDWPEYGVRAKGQVVDLMTSQGSCWFMHKSWFKKFGGLDDKNYGTMGAEAQEVCLKTWLGGGRYVLNKNTWYAHKKKRNAFPYKGYDKPTGEWKKSRAYAIECWTNNEWEGQVKDLEWLINKFKPVPGWHTSMENVETNRYIYEKYNMNYGTEERVWVIKGLNRRGLAKLWGELGYKVGCEVGVAAGYYSNVMFEEIPDLKMFLVEPYFDYSGGKRYKDLHKSYGEQAMERLGDRNIEWIKELSETAFTKIPDRSLDFVYIDGNHKYSYVMLDLLLWSRKVKRGGMIAGHDYESKGGRHVGGVSVAVDQFIEANKIAPVFLTDNTAIEHKSDRHASFFWVK